MTRSAPAAVDSPAGGQPELTHRQVLVVLSGLLLGMFRCRCARRAASPPRRPTPTPTLHTTRAATAVL